MPLQGDYMYYYFIFMPKAMPWADSLLAFQAVSIILFRKNTKNISISLIMK